MTLAADLFDGVLAGALGQRGRRLGGKVFARAGARQAERDDRDQDDSSGDQRESSGRHHKREDNLGPA